ncbi:hypothetical protein [Leptothoe sp. PORK10 BA2]|nr:hypothetical protein [Leptothoe sp. PORK10 BA2]
MGLSQLIDLTVLVEQKYGGIVVVLMSVMLEPTCFLQRWLNQPE